MVEVLNKGFYTTVQDLGRAKHQNLGVPISGVMDQRAAKLANAMVGNNENEAVLEITMSGPKLKFGKASVIAIAGANMSPLLNGKPIKNNRFHLIKKDDVLSFGRLISGFRCYLAVLGGFQTKTVLGSRSMYQGITSKFKIEKRDILEIQPVNSSSVQKHHSGLRVDEDYINDSTISVYEGPEFYQLKDSQKEQLFSKPFTISKDNNRMAYQLQEVIPNSLEPIITSPVLPGTLQLTPSGKLIVLMRDCQTTGGYPRVLQLTNEAINTLAQKYSGNSISFQKA